MVQTHRFSKYFLIIFMLISTTLGVLRFSSLQLGASYDDAHYIILAESLSSGQGYGLINFPNPQIERAFPPGWPILLTPVATLFSGDYSAFKIFTLILWIVSLPLIYILFSKRIESPYLEILIGLVAVNPLLVGTSVTVMSESAYLFFSLVTLILFDSWNETSSSYDSVQPTSVALPENLSSRSPPSRSMNEETKLGTGQKLLSRLQADSILERLGRLERFSEIMIVLLQQQLDATSRIAEGIPTDQSAERQGESASSGKGDVEPSEEYADATIEFDSRIQPRNVQ